MLVKVVRIMVIQVGSLLEPYSFARLGIVDVGLKGDASVLPVSDDELKWITLTFESSP